MISIEQAYWEEYDILYYYWVLAYYFGEWVYFDLQRCVFPIVTNNKCRPWSRLDVRK